MPISKAVKSLSSVIDALKGRLPLLAGGPAIAWITPSLAQGSRFTPAQVGTLARGGVTSVLDIRKEARDDEDVLARHGIRLCHVPMTDMAAPTQRQLKRAVEWVMGELAADRKVYVHCQSGVGRSVCVACAVLVRMGYGLPEAYEAVRRKRPEAVISQQQIAALERYAHSLSARTAT